MLSFGSDKQVIVLESDQTAVTISENTTNERILAIVDIPAGLMGANGKIVMRVVITHTSSANNKNYRTYLGNGSGAVGGAFTANTSTAFNVVTATASSVSCGMELHIGNRGSEAVNVGGQVAVRAMPASNAIVTGVIDTAAAGQRLVLTAQKATGTESVTLETIDVMVIK